MAGGSTENGKPAYAAPALSKGLDVLELLAERGVPMTMTEIADALSRSKSELFRMLIALVERDYIDRDPVTEAFHLTDRLFRLGLQTPRARDLLSAAMPEMGLLADRSEQSPHLVVVHGGATAVVAAVPGGGDFSFTLRLGYGRIATDATSGSTILAFQPDEVRARMIAESEMLAGAAADRVRLDATLEEIRARGYALRVSRDFVGVTDICCPILSDGRAVASIIIAYVDRHAKPDRHEAVLDLLRPACRRISALLPAGLGR